MINIDRILICDMPISNSETIHSEMDKLIPIYSKSLFFKMNNVFKNRTTFSILMWLYENEAGMNVEDVIAGFNLSRASAFRYCRMLADARVVTRIWDVAEKDIRAYARNRFVISKYGKKMVETLFSLEKNVEPLEVAEVESQEWKLREEVSAKLDRRIAGRLANHVHTKKLEDIIFTLLSKEYADIKDRTVQIVWARTSPPASIIWSKDKVDIIRCNIVVQKWPEPAVIGLLAHELSHIALGTDWHSEFQTDEDVIHRKLGHFLAIERAYTKKYSDHILREGEDKYLGYDSIRKKLKSREIKKLDKLLSGLGLVAISKK